MIRAFLVGCCLGVMGLTPLHAIGFRVPLTGVIEQANLKKIAVRQGGKRLKVRILPDKALFTFDPYGGPIDVVLTREK